MPLRQCPHCAEQISDRAAICPSCKRDVREQPSSKKCPFCAEDIQYAAVVCRYCGRELPALATAPAEPPTAGAEARQPRSSTLVMKVGGGCVLFLIVFLAAGVAAATHWAVGATLALMLLAWVGASVVGRLRGNAVRGVAAIASKRPGWSIVVGVAIALGVWAGVSSSISEGRKKAAEQAQREQAQKAADAAKAKTLAEIPAKMAQLNGRIAAKDWEAAGRIEAEIRTVKPDTPGLAEASAAIGPQLARLRKQKARTEALAEARSVVTDKTKCGTPKAVADAWNKLKLLKKEDGDWTQAANLAAQLEGCRKSMEATLSKGMRDIMIQQRVAMANKMETAALDQGLDFDFTLGGANKDHLTMKWALMSKVVVHKFTDGGSMREGSFLNSAQKVGFRRVTFSDGFDFGVYYDLEPADESSGGATVLTQMGIGEPFVLR